MRIHDHIERLAQRRLKSHCRRPVDAVQHRREVNVPHAQQSHPLQRPLPTEEVRDEIVRRRPQQLRWAAELLEDTADVQKRDVVGQLDCLVDVMSDEHDRLVHPALQ